MSEPEYTDLETVFEGEISEADVLRSVLEAAGFSTCLANENIKVMDPFVTGAGALSVKLRARRDEAEEVRAVIAELRARESPMEVDPADRAFESASRRRVRAGWFIVIALFLGFPTVILILIAALL
jgi:hypothetical protein